MKPTNKAASPSLLTHQILDQKMGLARTHSSNSRGVPSQTPRTMTACGSAYLLIDTSYSMEGEPLREAKAGALEFLNELQVTAIPTGLICFDYCGREIFPPITDLSQARLHINSLHTDGGTNLTDALKIALDRLKVRPGRRLAVVVSDGMPDCPESALTTAKDMKKAGIEIRTIGTRDADRDFLQKLAGLPENTTITSPTELRLTMKKQGQLMATKALQGLPWKGGA